ncbi:MAG TPA: hypothetical protein VL172_11515 [Kofleriaceae bacterium]|jgi:hypothetical protein|nr:hypothetical protein [Kofleriaceae bacterium]
MATANKTRRELAHYFEYSPHGIEVVEDGLTEVTFGEFLVERQAITRAQLFAALQLQDRQPGARIGECVAALGFLRYRDVEAYLRDWNTMEVVNVAPRA